MIRRFKHRGLRRLFETGDQRGLPAAFVPRVQRILARLDEATEARHMNLPGYRLHRLTGRRAGSWAVAVSGNWRIVFGFEDGHATDVDLVDYH